MDGWPWKLTRGDVKKNLEEVRGLAEHELTDGTVAKIRFLLDAQYNEEQIALGIRLLGDAPFSTLDVEQAHGSLAVIRRYHQGFALASFVYRSYLHMVRHFFCEGPSSGRAASSSSGGLTSCRNRRNRRRRLAAYSTSSCSSVSSRTACP